MKLNVFKQMFVTVIHLQYFLYYDYHIYGGQSCFLVPFLPNISWKHDHIQTPLEASKEVGVEVDAG